VVYYIKYEFDNRAFEFGAGIGRNDCSTTTGDFSKELDGEDYVTVTEVLPQSWPPAYQFTINSGPGEPGEFCTFVQDDDTAGSAKAGRNTCTEGQSTEDCKRITYRTTGRLEVSNAGAFIVCCPP
jgi:hypothetical protein